MFNMNIVLLEKDAVEWLNCAFLILMVMYVNMK